MPPHRFQITFLDSLSTLISKTSTPDVYLIQDRRYHRNLPRAQKLQKKSAKVFNF